ncbi:MAG: alpha/beta fold hydrolase [Sneathiella sp.]|nr:alpha/beta fold hydrolase [Sneathiella sp.]
MLTKINDILFDVELDGPENAPAVTLSHSLSTNLRAWDDLVEMLLPKYRVLRYSMRGHGKSEPVSGPYSLKGLVGDIAAIQDYFGISKSHFVGLSIGGMIAQAYALEFPARLKKLVISSSLCRLSESAEAMWKKRIKAIEKSGIEAIVEPTIKRWFAEETRKAAHPVIDRTRAFIRETSEEGYVGCCQAISKLNLFDRLKQITAPTLVIVGQDDKGTPVAASEIIHHQIPNSELLIVNKASHQVAMEQPKIFNSAVLGFLGK